MEVSNNLTILFCLSLFVEVCTLDLDTFSFLFGSIYNGYTCPESSASNTTQGREPT